MFFASSIAGGVPIGAYGMTEDVAEVFRSADPPEGAHPGVATGGTPFANALTFAAARAAAGGRVDRPARSRAAVGQRLGRGDYRSGIHLGQAAAEARLVLFAALFAAWHAMPEVGRLNSLQQ